MLPWEKGVFGRNFMFVQDNALPRLARDSMAFLDQYDVEVMDWPALSPDVKLLEHGRNQMSIWMRDIDRVPSKLAELCKAVRQAWRPNGHITQ